MLHICMHACVVTAIAYIPKDLRHGPYYNDSTVGTAEEWVAKHASACAQCKKHLAQQQYEKLAVHLQQWHTPACYNYAELPSALLPKKGFMPEIVGKETITMLNTAWRLQERCDTNKASAREQQQWSTVYLPFIELSKTHAVRPLWTQLYIASMRA
jgi:hypothetical protein